MPLHTFYCVKNNLSKFDLDANRFFSIYKMTYLNVCLKISSTVLSSKFVNFQNPNIQKEFQNEFDLRKF
jgi:hypothetical protein